MTWQEIDLACEALRLDDLQALAFARFAGVPIRERVELIDERIRRRSERRTVKTARRVRRRRCDGNRVE